MFGMGKHADQIGDLRIGRFAIGAGDVGEVSMRMLFLQSLNNSGRRILSVLNPEEDLYRGRVVLGEETFQIFRKAAFGAVKRFQHRHRRAMRFIGSGRDEESFDRARGCHSVTRPDQGAGHQKPSYGGGKYKHFSILTLCGRLA